MQADIDKKRTMIQIVRDLTTEHGLRGHFMGMTPLLIRGFLVNAVCLAVYVQSLKILNKYS
jgi:hypothetical protein